jgi:hypothetical protein
MSHLDVFVAAGPWPQRAVLRALVSLARRPRGRALLGCLPPADRLARSLLAMERYDDPAVSRPLGWDPVAVTARGRELRVAEGRP